MSKTVKIGTKFRERSGDVYVLASVAGSNVGLIGIEDGVRWAEPVNVPFGTDPTEFQVKELLNGDDLADWEIQPAKNKSFIPLTDYFRPEPPKTVGMGTKLRKFGSRYVLAAWGSSKLMGVTHIECGTHYGPGVSPLNHMAITESELQVALGGYEYSEFEISTDNGTTWTQINKFFNQA